MRLSCVNQSQTLVGMSTSHTELKTSSIEDKTTALLCLPNDEFEDWKIQKPGVHKSSRPAELISIKERAFLSETPEVDDTMPSSNLLRGRKAALVRIRFESNEPCQPGNMKEVIAILETLNGHVSLTRHTTRPRDRFLIIESKPSQ